MRAIVFYRKIQSNVNHSNEFYTAQQYKTVYSKRNKANLLNVMKCKQATWMAIYTRQAKLLVSVIWIRFYHSNSPLKSKPTDLATSWAPGWMEPYG